MRLTVVLHYSPTDKEDPELYGVTDGFLRPEGAWVKSTEYKSNYSSDTVSATVYLPNKESTVHYEIYSTFLPLSSREKEWNFTATAEPLNHNIPHNFPVAFAIPDQNHPPRFEPTDKTVPFVLWGPNDDFLGTFNTTSNSYIEAIKSHDQSGEYIVYAPGSIGEISIEADPNANGARGLEALDTEPIYHDWHAASLDEPAEWTFGLDRVPLAIGLAVRVREAALVHYISPELDLETPTGRSYSYDTAGSSGGAGNLQTTSPREYLTVYAGAEGIGPGTYHATYTPNGYGTEATHFTRDYVRP